jgi:uncharacterized repeat protein (TIGR03803 family)
MFYGATASGGTFNEGTAYKLDPATGDETVLYNFTGGADGATPFADLTYNRDMLYGTTQYGPGKSCGGKGCGSVFAVDAKTGVETTLHSFTGGADGGVPATPLAYHMGIFYGTTTTGGGSGCGGTGCGTVFSLTPQR